MHIAAVVIAFGVDVRLSGHVRRRHPRRAALDAWHAPHPGRVGKLVISPFLGLALLAGIYLASKLHTWSDFYVQWGLA